MRSSVQGTCLANDSPLRPEGRFGRLSFAAWSLLGSLFFLIACSTIGFGLIQMSEKQSSYSNQTILFMICSIGTLTAIFVYYHFIFMIRRLHDCNQSGWLSLLYMVPLINIVFMVYLLCAKGNTRLNDFGPTRYTCKWERFFGWIYIILVPLSLMIGLLSILLIPTYQTYLQ
ncbi:DUF805 domain-containing protein [Acinetobacter ursingii]|uniref:DUF805 domain-containing protein n=1 Tax=Acinetobacter ursingii TaxID=108980 RepID=A0AA46NML4_9GAMM|nr:MULTISPECIES: DUF805 domain-containing protein [Acinetobacter]MEC8057693.1 DUF805 domain-containing protein [Pseudomonadota bacterium]NOZ96705.1 DUF805 domain-containing protein [Gammaproteobacteria bacterium]MCU4487789.1 DUF805 domain-containing protein [Acinetobacter ursingii]MCU4495673.1 DUF805 domain-containing protein [Acinetobacter ursingii]MCU4604553.1 DUF805 domain-containing protein [Acinetobacter ursingii]